MPASPPATKRIAGTLRLCTAVIALAAPAGNQAASAAHSCETEYDTAKIAIATEIHENGDRQTLQTRLDNAWRAFWKDRKLGIANAQLDVLQQLLQGNATEGVTEGSREVVAEAVAAFRACINGESPIGTATLTVRTFELNETRVDGKGAPAGPGVYLYVDGRLLGTTGADGTATLTVPAGLVSVQAIVPSRAIAETAVDIAKGASLTVDLVLDDSKEVTSPVDVSVSSVTGQVVPADADSFTISLLESGVLRPVVAVADVTLEDDIGNTLAVLGPHFQVSGDGRLVPIDLAGIMGVLRSYAGRPLVLSVMAEDAAGFTLSGTMPLFSVSTRCS